jgi:DNA-binding NtrC family response regulator
MTMPNESPARGRAGPTPRRLFTTAERQFAGRISRLAHTNPFVPESIACVKEALGPDFVPVDPVWSMRPQLQQSDPNRMRLQERVEAVARASRERLAAGARPRDEEGELYQDLCLYRAYFRHEANLFRTVEGDARAAAQRTSWRRFSEEIRQALAVPGLRLLAAEDPAHLYACFFQLSRAAHHIYFHIVGRSMPAARLRAAVWQSIFTHDMRRYRRSLYQKMSDVTTLVTGASGTGKELVARAIGLSRYLPFDPRTERFAAEPAEAFHVLDVSALSPTLVESELFGHRRGAFTGAVEDRAGWLETCPRLGTVFLDEVGEIDPAIQVKLLRVLQERTFQRLGETVPRRFDGKIIAATNRDLAAEIAAGRFRADFYYRLCADVIRTPSLAEQLRDAPGELSSLVLFLVRRVVGEQDSGELAAEVELWIRTHLGPDYEWPGNVRELEQCVRNVMVRGEYRPLPSPRSAGAPGGSLEASVSDARLTADELLDAYCALVHARTGSFVEAARRLGLDRRTVRARVARSRTAGAGRPRPQA